IGDNPAEVGVNLLPAEKLAVKRKRLLPIDGRKFVPADMARRGQRGGLLLAGVQPLDQGERRRLRIGDDRKAADLGDVRRRNIYGAAKTLKSIGRGIHVVDADIT